MIFQVGLHNTKVPLSNFVWLSTQALFCIHAVMQRPSKCQHKAQYEGNGKSDRTLFECCNTVMMPGKASLDALCLVVDHGTSSKNGRRTDIGRIIEVDALG